MLINNLSVYDKYSRFLGVATRLMNDKTSHLYECDAVVENDVLYVISQQYDIVVKQFHGLYKMTVFDWFNETEHNHYICNIRNIAKAIRNIHIYHKAYEYAYAYEYLLGGNYIVSPILTRANSIHICIVDTEKFDTITGIEFRHYSDGRYVYRYHFSDNEHSVKSECSILRDFLEGWA